jgi:hypothetical protein
VNLIQHKNMGFPLRLGMAACLALLLLPAPVPAVSVEKRSQTVIEDSEEPFGRRIYSYAITTDTNGLLHILYSKPVPGENRSEIIYATGTATNLNKTVLETDGNLGSISTSLIAGKTGSVVHASYLKHQSDPATHLVYQTIEAGTPSAQQQVAMGGWHSRMQLDSEGKPVIVRENGQSLRMFRPGAAEGTWDGTSFAPSGSIQYRIADFVFDPMQNRFHITYGDNAGTTNGAPLHNFLYAASTNATDWTASTIDNSLTLWELEFWTSMILDPDGLPIVSMYKFAQYNGTYNTGTSLLLGRHDGTNWTTRRIVGYIPGETPPDHRAGMGGQLITDEAGVLYGAWDNSPDRPIDFDGAYGNIAMDHSEPGSEWRSQFQVEPFSAEGYCRMAIHGTNLYLLALGHYADTKLYLIHLGIDRRWDDGYTDLGSGWRRLAGFGDYIPMGPDGWIWHNKHGFWYAPPGSTPESIWFFSGDMGWLWTSRTLYPFLFRANDGAWLWYNGSRNPRWFMNFTAGVWEHRP